MKFKLVVIGSISVFMALQLPGFGVARLQDDPFGQVQQPAQVQQEAIRVPAGNPQDEEAKKDEASEESEDDSQVTDTKTLIQDQPEFPQNYIRFHMWDGSIVAGEVTVDEISIKTEFGVLEVPIERIRKMYPGLDSFPQLAAQIESLVEGLGDKDFDIREKSQRALTNMGMQIRNELERFEDGGNAERKKRLAAIQKEINETLDEADEEEEFAQRSLIRGDSVETPEFAIVGKVLEETFVLNSKFGTLTVNLSDVKMAERQVEQTLETIKKTVEVGAEKFFQRQPVSTKIRVNKGDKISIKADGVVQWTNWSTSSTPDGLTNQGMYQGIPSGTLCARIGTTGKVVKVGRSNEWKASKSGVLYLAIAMQDNYLNNNGYRWTGEYKAKVQVKPTGAE